MLLMLIAFFKGITIFANRFSYAILNRIRLGVILINNIVATQMSILLDTISLIVILLMATKLLRGMFSLAIGCATNCNTVSDKSV